MLKSLIALVSTPRVQLNFIGIGLLFLLVVGARMNLANFTWESIIPLLCIGYAVFRVVFELTINRNNVPTLATGFAARRLMAKRLTTEAQATQQKRGDKPYTIVDFGSGRGELTRHLARKVKGSQVTGLELARWPYKQSVFFKRCFGLTNVDYQCINFDTFDCSKTDAVVMYLSGNLTRHVGEKLHRELPPGALVIAHTFPLRGEWTPLEIIDFRTPFKEQIYVYRKA